MIIASINWNINPDLFHLGPLTVRWYGLCWVMAFIFGIYITKKLFTKDKINPDLVDTLFVYVFIGSVLGARLGHVFFYGWEYYSKHLLDIFKIWEGGLASHGGAIGIIIALWFFSKYASKKSMLWILDRVVIPVALAGMFIRLGNLMNSEIYGIETHLPWGFIFERNHETVAKHPTQIYEALVSLFLFIVLWRQFFKTDIRNKTGKLFGIFTTILFSMRFLIEFIKENQEAFENDMLLNMGQILSIPFVLAGLYFWFRPHK